MRAFTLIVLVGVACAVVLNVDAVKAAAGGDADEAATMSKLGAMVQEKLKAEEGKGGNKAAVMDKIKAFLKSKDKDFKAGPNKEAYKKFMSKLDSLGKGGKGFADMAKAKGGGAFKKMQDFFNSKKA